MQVRVVSKDYAGLDLLGSLRRWQQSGDWAAKQHLDSVQLCQGSLAEAEVWRREDDSNRLLVAVGFGQREMASLPNEAKRSVRGRSRLGNRPVVIFAAVPGVASAEASDAREGDPLHKIRQILLERQLPSGTKARVIETCEEMLAYFRLRYRIWNADGYIPDERNARDSGLELEYSDRSAIPLGLFDEDGRLVGCARLVSSFGKERKRYVAMIETILSKLQDPILDAAFRRPPRGMNQPFDVLEYFPDFRDYYSKLVRSARGNQRAVVVGEVSRVIVDEPFRGHRYSEILVTELITLARREGVNKLLLACREDLMPLYANCGFRQVEGLRSISFGSIPVPSFVMERDI